MIFSIEEHIYKQTRKRSKRIGHVSREFVFREDGERDCEGEDQDVRCEKEEYVWYFGHVVIALVYLSTDKQKRDAGNETSYRLQIVYGGILDDCAGVSLHEFRFDDLL